MSITKIGKTVLDTQGRRRDYQSEYRSYHGSAEQRRNRSERNKARRALGLKVGDPREADHKKPISRGGTNSEGNLRAVSRATNRKKWDKVAADSDAAAFAHSTGKENLRRMLASGSIKPLESLAKDDPQRSLSVEPWRWNRERQELPAAEAVQILKERGKHPDKVFLTRDGFVPDYETGSGRAHVL